MTQYAAKYMVPCDCFLAAQNAECGATPTKRFLTGQRCQNHQPSRQAGHPDPPKPRKYDPPVSRVTPLPPRRPLPPDSEEPTSGPKSAPSSAYRDAKAAQKKPR